MSRLTKIVPLITKKIDKEAYKEYTIRAPAGFNTLCTSNEGGYVFVHMMIIDDDSAEYVDHRIMAVGVGANIPDGDLEYIGYADIGGKNFHLFRVLETISQHFNRYP